MKSSEGVANGAVRGMTSGEQQGVWLVESNKGCG